MIDITYLGHIFPFFDPLLYLVIFSIIYSNLMIIVVVVLCFWSGRSGLGEQCHFFSFSRLGRAVLKHFGDVIDQTG